MLRMAIAGLLALVAMAGDRTFADAESDRVLCFSLGNENYNDASKYDLDATSCTRMINSGRFKGKGLASIYRARGSWKQKKGDVAKAREEYNAAIAVPTADRIAKWAQDNARARLKALAEETK
jgi:hypothetical protein